MADKDEFPLMAEPKKVLAKLEETEIKHNPFGKVPDEQIEKALKILEEYSEEINPF